MYVLCFGQFIIEGTVGNGSRGDIALDDLTVLDGVCEKIIAQGKLSKREPQIDYSFIPVLANYLRLKSDRFLATPKTSQLIFSRMMETP